MREEKRRADFGGVLVSDRVWASWAPDVVAMDWWASKRKRGVKVTCLLLVAESGDLDLTAREEYRV